MGRRKAPYYNGEDRITKLPETLIHHILSFLDMKFVVRTCVLSKRWRCIWKSHHSLNFDSFLFRNHETNLSDGLVDFIDRVLMLRESSNIQRFHLECGDDLDLDIENHLYTWILALVSRNVQELHVSVADNQVFKFPDGLFTCTSLTKLELRMSGNNYENISPPYAIALPCLKYLKLDGLSLEDENLANKLISSCPILESLTVIDTRINLNIYSLQLRHFKLEYRYTCDVNGGVKTVKLYAPNLISFSCKDFMSQDYTLENLSSLVTADIDMVVVEEEAVVRGRYSELSLENKELYAQRMMKILSAVRNVKELTLSSRILEVLSRAPDLSDSEFPRFCNVRCLKLDTWFSKDCLHAITYLLKNSPNIESLFLKLLEKRLFVPSMPPYSDVIESRSEIIEDYEEVRLLPCMLHHLKYVDMEGIEGGINELMFLESLLKNSVVLETVVLTSAAYRDFCKWDTTVGQLKKFRQNLLTCPKASARTAIFFRL